MRLAMYHAPHAAPATETMYSATRSIGLTAGFGLAIVVIVRGRAIVGARIVPVIGSWLVAAVGLLGVCAGAACVGVRCGTGFGVPDIVPPLENVDSVSRLNARS